MALHNFDYTYEFVNCETTFKSGTDRTPIVAQVTVNITAVDKSDDTKTITTQETRALNYGLLQSQTLPDSFIPIASLTNDQMIDWFKAGVATADLDGFYTWQLYGHAEMDGT
jgi:hypothetical protein